MVSRASRQYHVLGMPREPRSFRSLLFVPADSDKKLAKAKEIPADALVIDWEDAQLPQDKPRARRRTLELLEHREQYPQLLLVRLNPAGTESFRDDCEALADGLPDGLMLSKCGSVDEVFQLVDFLTRTHPTATCSVYPFIESPGGLLSAFEIAHCSNRVAGLAFGAEDFSAETGVRRTAEEIELLYARSALVTACRAAGREVYDSPCIDFRDLEKAQGSADRARNLGFTGKMAIHPAQVPIIHAAFTPTAAEVEEARRLLQAFSAQGAGVLAVEGRMVDEPILRRARRTLELAGSSEDP